MTADKARAREDADAPQVDGRPLDDLLKDLRPQLKRMVAFRMDPRLRPRVDPSDVVQETYVEVLRRIEDYKASPAVPFFLWVRQLATQRLIDLYRAHMGAARRDLRREAHASAPGLNSSVSLAHALTDDGPSPSVFAVRAEDKQRLQEALEGMSEADREVLMLRHFEGLDFKQCAHVIGVSHTAVRMRHIRALSRLSEILHQLGGGEEPSWIGT